MKNLRKLMRVHLIGMEMGDRVGSAHYCNHEIVGSSVTYKKRDWVHGVPVLGPNT